MSRNRLRVLPVLLLAAGTFVACSAGSEMPTACDGFADRTTGILGREYRECAREILAQLDTLERYLRKTVQGDTTSWADARMSYRRVRRLIRKTGMERDYRSGSNAVVQQRWPQGVVQSFNFSASSAVSQWGSAVRRPNTGNYGEGMRHYENARRWYGQAW